MGTAFDAFTPLSYHGVPGEICLRRRAALQTRAMLLGIMTAAGWDVYRNEWWHYQLFNARARYPVLDDSACPQSMMSGR